DKRITIVPHGVMSAVPETGMTREEARQQLGLGPKQRVLLAFGLISPYKGLETLVLALRLLRLENPDYFLVIAGRIKECPDYWSQVRSIIDREGLDGAVQTELRHIPDERVEAYL